MGYRTFHSTLSTAPQPTRGLARTVCRVSARLGNGFEGYVSKASFRASGSEIFVRALEDFRDFFRATQRSGLLSRLRFSVWRDECVSYENRGLARATSLPWRVLLRDLASSVLSHAGWQHFGPVFRTKVLDGCATSWRISESRISFYLPRSVRSTVSTVLRLCSYLEIYPQNLMTARRI